MYELVVVPLLLEIREEIGQESHFYLSHRLQDELLYRFSRKPLLTQQPTRLLSLSGNEMQDDAVAHVVRFSVPDATILNPPRKPFGGVASGVAC